MYKKIMKLLPASLLLIAGSAQAANPVNLDFENTLPTWFGLTTYQQDGMTLTSNVPTGTLIDVNNTVRGGLGLFGGGNNTQSIFWGENGTNSTLSLVDDGGARFDLLSLDASSLQNASGVLTLSGITAWGGSVSQILNLNPTLSTYNITGMSSLVSLDISFDGTLYGAPFDLDNINMSVVPIPAAVWMFGSALAGLIGWSRRRAVTS